MFVYFEDWSGYADTMDAKGLPHTGRLLKVFTSLQDPRLSIQKPNMSFFEVDDQPFGPHEQFAYGNRDTYTGDTLEAMLVTQNFRDEGQRRFRALFRFANREEFQFCQQSMRAKQPDGSWWKTHPFYVIDIRRDKRDNENNQTIHIDVFYHESLSRLRAVLDIDDPSYFVTPREGLSIRQHERTPQEDIEISNTCRERR